MTTLTLPDVDLGWARTRVDAGHAPSVEAYIVDLLRRDREHAEETAWLQARMDEADASGTDPRSSDEIFTSLFQKHFGVDA